MGTRHFVGVIADGKYKIANYGQWDGYVEGQGARVLDFLSNADMAVFGDKLNNCRFITNDEIRKMYVEAGDDPNNNSGWISHDVATRFNNRHPSLSRDTGAGILDIVYNSEEEVPLWNSEDFFADDTWCEFAYIIDVTNGTLRCYTNGTQLFGEYIFEDLPTVADMQYDYNQWCKKTYGEEEEY